MGNKPPRPQGHMTTREESGKRAYHVTSKLPNSESAAIWSQSKSPICLKSTWHAICQNLLSPQFWMQRRHWNEGKALRHNLVPRGFPYLIQFVGYTMAIMFPDKYWQTGSLGARGKCMEDSTFVSIFCTALWRELRMWHTLDRCQTNPWHSITLTKTRFLSLHNWAPPPKPWTQTMFSLKTACHSTWFRSLLSNLSGRNWLRDKPKTST